MAINNIDNLRLGSLVQTVFSNGVRNQISEDFRDFEYIGKFRDGRSLAREIKFMFLEDYGLQGIQYRDPGTSGRSFPTGRQSTISEKVAKFKELNATIELEYNLWYRAMKSPEKYGEPLALEMDSKMRGLKRRLAADFHGDGTGVVGTVASAAVESPASDKLVFTLSTANTARGHVGFFEFGDILVLKASAGTASALDTNLATEPVYWRVTARDRANAQVTLQGLDSSLASAGTMNAVSVQPTAGDVFYREGQPTVPDLTAAIADYGLVTEVPAGLESLVSDDGRVVHDITMSGATAGSMYDAGGNLIDANHFQAALDNVKVAVGQGKYAWKMAIMAPETHASLIEGREVDRRFHTVEDNKRGVRFWAYQHQNDSVEAYTSEYALPKRVRFIPEGKADGGKVLQYWASDFEMVKGPIAGDWHLKPGSSGGHVNNIIGYMQGVCVFICNHPAAIASIDNFTT